MNETDEPRGKERTVERLMGRGCWEGETDVRHGRQTMMPVYAERRERGDEDQTSVSS